MLIRITTLSIATTPCYVVRGIVRWLSFRCRLWTLPVMTAIRVLLFVVTGRGNGNGMTHNYTITPISNKKHTYMTDYENKILNRIGQLSQEGLLTDEFHVSCMKLCEEFLNLKTIKDFSQEAGKSPQGIRRYRKDSIIKIRNNQYIIDNE